MDVAAIINKIDELSKKVSSIEKSLQEQTNSIFVQMNVKVLHLNTLNLDELAFHLDKLDIKELSGMLNLGNTFSPTIQPKLKAEKRTKQKQADDIRIIINGKSVPYTIT